MPYISKEEVKEIRQKLNKEFKDKGFKFSVTREDGHLVNVSIIKSKEDFSDILENETYVELNQYYLEEYGSHHYKTLKRIRDIITSLDTYNDCIYEDIDYGKFPSYYYTINIGKYNKSWSLQE